ncbi:MAG: cobalamin B12-binding domain-containing protein [Chloroflexi bacterium]|nr:cobalamin B12-binding domain-containing protein [Chloroflexota bacterium]
MKKPIRILIAKPGLDGHDRGAKVISLAMRNAGFEVIYTGLHQTIDQIIEAAVQEDVDVVGLSILSGAHIPISKKLIAKMKKIGIDEKLVLIGGNIPKQDFETLKALGVGGIFPTGSNFDDVEKFILSNINL